MMTLTLRIDNFDTLDDGGPTWITLNQSGASVGRRTSMDWVLPDPAKHISGHHFDIQFAEGAYWLNDVSTNGTFMQGSHHRLSGPVQLQGGERLIVGHYVIVVEGPGAHVSAPQPTSANTWANVHEDADPWDLGAEPLQPVNPLPNRPVDPHHLDDLARDFVPLQRPSSDAAAHQENAAPLQQPPVPNGLPGDGAFGTPPPPSSAPGAVPAMPIPTPAPAQPYPSASTPSGFSRPEPPAQSPTSETLSKDDVLHAFCKGAGLPPEAARDVDPLILIEALGRSTKVAVDQVMQMLQDRANVKQFTRGGERTMRSATGNNPMKFLPDARQAFAALFLQPREGFMTGPEGFENALDDLRRHQMAVFAALQPALADVLAGLSPDEIEDRETTAGNLLSGSKRGKNWDAFVKRWDEKASVGDHGMLDVFLRAFAKAYAEAAARSQ